MTDSKEMTTEDIFAVKNPTDDELREAKKRLYYSEMQPFACVVFDRILHLEQRLEQSNKCLLQMQNANIDLVRQLEQSEREKEEAEVNILKELHTILNNWNLAGEGVAYCVFNLISEMLDNKTQKGQP